MQVLTTTDLHGSLGFILHARPYRDTSLLIDSFTQTQGRIKAVARSARGPRSRFRGILQPFVPLLLNFKGKTELVTLTQAELVDVPFTFAHERLFAALYINELLYHLLQPHDAHQALFDGYCQTLQQLQIAENIEVILREFELMLLAILGYGLALSHDANAQPLLAQNYYCFIGQHGLQKTERCDGSDVFLGEHCLRMDARDWQPEILHSAKRLLRLAVQIVLDRKKIRAREFFLANSRSSTYPT